MAREKIAWQNPNLRIIDGGVNNSDVNMTDRIMEQIGDNMPSDIMEDEKTKETANDRNVRIIPFNSNGISYIIWESKHSVEAEESQKSIRRNSFLDRLKRFFNKE